MCSGAAPVLIALLLGLPAGMGACKDSGSKPILEDASFVRRVFRRPPAGEVRAVPPHNIHSKGVGPYELSASFQKTLALLPNGPRVERFESDGLFDYRLMRTDNDALLLGVGRENRVTFISVLDPDIARTESGIGVGAGVDELIGALGGVLVPAGTGRDPRIVTFTALPQTRFIVEGGTVVAALVTESAGAATSSSSVPAESVPSPEKPTTVDVPAAVKAYKCNSLTLRDRKSEILALADFGSDATSLVWTCLSGETGEVVVRSGEWLKLIGSQGPGAPLRLIAKAQLPGLSFATALSTGGERTELYTVSNREGSESRALVVTRFRVSGARLVAVWTKTAFELEASAATWLGAKLAATDFLVEVRGGERLLKVSGIFVQREGGVLRNVVPMNTVEMVVSSPERKPPPAGDPKSPVFDAGPAKSRPSGAH